MESVLETAKEDLLKPSKNTLRYLVIALNVVYLLSAIFFLTSEKLAEGKFVPIIELFYIAFLPALMSNTISLIYNALGLWIKDSKKENKWIQYFYVKNGRKLQKATSWVSVISVMFMSFIHINGVGNPSNDAIITDYALAHSLIMVGVIIMGRKGATVWCLIVLVTLMFNVNKMGWDYKFHYLTPNEARNYEIALENEEEWALQRNYELIVNGLNPPKVSRYFNTWLIFIIVAYFGAYFYSGITTDILKVLPSVVKKIEKGIEENYKVKSDLVIHQKESALTSLRIHHNSELFDKILTEFNKLEYKEKKKFRPIIDLIRKELSIQDDWENLKVNFNSIHNGFFKYLDESYPNLSDSDKRHLSYIRMNLDNVYVAHLMGVKRESLRKHRYRLKVKLGLNNDQDLYEFLKSINGHNQ